MQKYHLSFHHLGLAVSLPDKAVQFLEGIGYTPGETVLDPVQNVRLIMCTHPAMPDIEVIFRTDTRGPVDFILKDRTELIYHFCYETDSVQQVLDAMKQDGLVIRVLSKPKPAVLFGGRNVSFYHVSGIGIIEIIETGKI